MRKENKYDRRRFLGIGTMAIAAANLGRSAEAQSSKATLADRTIKLRTNASLGALKQIETDVLSIGYAEAGSTAGAPVILLHGWPYDIHIFVGVGIATGQAQAASDFMVNTPSGERPVLDMATRGTYHREFVDDPEKCEYFVPIRGAQTVPVAKAVQEIGMFGNQNSACKPTTPKWRWTVERLKTRFPNFEKIESN